MSIMEEFVVDTNLVLDGELWGREPTSLMRETPELLPAGGGAIEKISLLYEPLLRSNVALEWFRKETPSRLREGVSFLFVE